MGRVRATRHHLQRGDGLSGQPPGDVARGGDDRRVVLRAPVRRRSSRTGATRSGVHLVRQHSALSASVLPPDGRGIEGQSRTTRSTVGHSPRSSGRRCWPEIRESTTVPLVRTAAAATGLQRRNRFSLTGRIKAVESAASRCFGVRTLLTSRRSNGAGAGLRGPNELLRSHVLPDVE